MTTFPNDPLIATLKILTKKQMKIEYQNCQQTKQQVICISNTALYILQNIKYKLH